MSDFMAQLFTVEELLNELNFRDLSPKELALMKAAIYREIYNSAYIKDVLKARIRQVYAQLRQGPSSESAEAYPSPGQTMP